MTATEDKMTIESSAFLYITDYMDMIHHFPSELQRTVSQITELDLLRVRLMDAIQATQNKFATKIDANTVTSQDEREYATRMQVLGAKYLEHTDERVKLVEFIKARVDCKKKQLEMGIKFTEDLIDKANGLPGNGTSGPKGLMGLGSRGGDTKTPVKLNKDKDGDSTILIKGTSGSKRGGRRGHGGKADSSNNSRDVDLGTGPGGKRAAGGKRGGKSGVVHKNDNARSRSSGRGSNANNNDNPDSPMLPDYDSNEPLYCHCQRISYGDMIGCDNSKCKYEWFHFPCVGLTNKPKGKWYCPDCRGERSTVPKTAK